MRRAQGGSTRSTACTEGPGPLGVGVHCSDSNACENRCACGCCPASFLQEPFFLFISCTCSRCDSSAKGTVMDHPLVMHACLLFNCVSACACRNCNGPALSDACMSAQSYMSAGGIEAERQLGISCMRRHEDCECCTLRLRGHGRQLASEPLQEAERHSICVDDDGPGWIFHAGPGHF